MLKVHAMKVTTDLRLNIFNCAADCLAIHPHEHISVREASI